MTEAEAYVAGWHACMAGVDGRYARTWQDENGYTEAHRYAWTSGFLDAMEAEDGEEPEPACAGYGVLAEREERRRNADHVDGYDRDDLGESPDF